MERVRELPVTVPHLVQAHRDRGATPAQRLAVIQFWLLLATLAPGRSPLTCVPASYTVDGVGSCFRGCPAALSSSQPAGEL